MAHQDWNRRWARIVARRINPGRVNLAALPRSILALAIAASLRCSGSGERLVESVSVESLGADPRLGDVVPVKVQLTWAGANPRDDLYLVIPWFRSVGLSAWRAHSNPDGFVVLGEALIRPDRWSQPPAVAWLHGRKQPEKLTLDIPTVEISAEHGTESSPSEIDVVLVDLAEPVADTYDAADQRVVVTGRPMLASLPAVEARFMIVDGADGPLVYGEITAKASDSIESWKLRRHRVTWHSTALPSEPTPVVVAFRYDTGWGVEPGLFDVVRLPPAPPSDGYERPDPTATR